MSGFARERSLADPREEEWVRENIGISLPLEKWVALHIHKFALFSFHERRYRDPELDVRVQELAEWLFAPSLSERIRAVREKYLSAEQMAEFEAYERDPF